MGSLRDVIPGIRRFLRGGPTTNIVVACFPKSGSTYISTLLREYTGFSVLALCEQFGHNEQDLSLNVLRTQAWRRDSVIQMHLKGTANNARLIEKFQLKPINLVRDIHDVVLSVVDHWHQESLVGPTGYVPAEALTWSRDELIDYLIAVHLPWYFNFLISWRDASKRLPTYWLTYERFFADQRTCLGEMLEFCGISVNQRDIDRAIEGMAGKFTRLNVGRSDRGKQLAPRHREAIRRLAAVWHTRENELAMIGVHVG